MKNNNQPIDEEIQSIKKELQRLKDIEAVRKLENSYGFYLINFMNQEIIDCFADREDTTVEFPEGTFLGKKGVERAFGTTNKNMDPEFMHQMMQLSGVIDIETDGKTAKGRWWGFGAMAIPSGEEISIGSKSEGIKQALACGVYENEFIKDHEVWKIWKLKWVPLYSCTPEHGWVKPERLSKQALETGGTKNPDWWKPDIPSEGKDYAYPSGYILPFHYRHPVTGKETSERFRNVTTGNE
jgi:hypothetical protein